MLSPGILGLVGLLLAPGAFAVTQVATYAGLGSGDGNLVPNCTFYVPSDVARVSAGPNAGDVYVADTANHVIRRISAAGVVSTLAGTYGVAGSTNGTGTSARFNSPKGVAVDANGNTLFVADTNNHLLRAILLPGAVVSTLAGTTVTGSANGNTAVALFNSPSDLVLDATGNTLYVADTGNHRVRVVYRRDPTNVVIGTLAGSSAGYLDHATGTSARFSAPSALAIEPLGNTLYVADTNNHVIRQILTLGTKTVSTVTGRAGVSGAANGDSTTATFAYPRGLAVDAANAALYVADTANHDLRTVNLGVPAKTTSAWAGVAGNTGNADSPAQFNLPLGLAWGAGGASLLAADSGNDAVRRITVPAAVVTTWAGGNGDGRTVPDAVLRAPSRLCFDAAGTLYAADADAHVIRKFSAGGAVTTLAGRWGVPGSADGAGTAASFRFPRGVALSPDGATLYVADGDNHTLRQVDTATGAVTLLAGSAGVTGTAGVLQTIGAGGSARFFNPQGLAVSPSGQFVYVADTNNHCIRRLDLAGSTCVTAFGSPTRQSGYLEGVSTTARFAYPADLALDATGNTLYVADAGNAAIRRIDLTTGEVATFLGAGLALSNPQGVAVSGNYVYFTDATNHNLFIGDAAHRTWTRLAGLGVSGLTEGAFTQARFNAPWGLAVSGSSLYVADALNRRIRRVTQLHEVRSLGLSPVLNDIFLAAEPDRPVLEIVPTIAGEDVLTSLTVDNAAGTAVAPGDIKSVRLWFQLGGGAPNTLTAVSLGPLTLTGDDHTWTSGPGAYNLTLHQNDSLFVTLDVGDIPTASRTCQFSVPAGGAVFASAAWPAAALTNDFYQTLAPAGTIFAIRHEAQLAPTVVRGQTRTPVMKLVFTNALNYPYPISALTFQLEDKDGNSLPASAALARVRVEGENGQVYALHDVGASDGSTLDLDFSTPLSVPGERSAALLIVAEISAQASAQSLRFNFATPSAVNHGTLEAIAAANDPTGFPMRTDYAHLENPDLIGTYSNYPNPFTPPRQTTRVKYYLTRPAKASVTLWTLTEDRVRTLAEEDAESVGYYTWEWDGKNGQGQLVASGVYLCRLRLVFDDGGSQVITRKIAVIR